MNYQQKLLSAISEYLQEQLGKGYKVYYTYAEDSRNNPLIIIANFSVFCQNLVSFYEISIDISTEKIIKTTFLEGETNTRIYQNIQNLRDKGFKVKLS